MTTKSSLSKLERGFLTIVLAVIFVLVAMDLVTDSAAGVQLSHLAVELGVALVALAGFFLLIRGSFQKTHELARSRESLREREIETQKWKQESQKYIQGLSQAIDSQLARWGLTPSEKEVALLLLKGLSVKEIAEARNTADKTVRAQAVSVYEKAGLAGRSELAAFFLEDLLLPPEATPARPLGDRAT
jgi:DNA-binding CsgD family transcriptional regulator